LEAPDLGSSHPIKEDGKWVRVEDPSPVKLGLVWAKVAHSKYHTIFRGLHPQDSSLGITNHFYATLGAHNR
jgi:hypothetical protein